METSDLLLQELIGSFDFFLGFTNLDPHSRGFGLTADSTKKPTVASIASVGFALTAWVIAAERGYLSRQKALDITRGTLHTLCERVSQYHGFFAHMLHMESGERFRKSEYSTIDTSLCLNGVITASAYFSDEEVRQLATQLLERVEWKHFVFEKDEKTLFRMAYNPDRNGDYADGSSGFISQWDMAAEQKMMYLQAAGQVEPSLASRLYRGFRRDVGEYDGQKIIINPGGNLFAYQFSEAWLDTASYLDPDGVDWFENTRLAALANRSFCMTQSRHYRSYHANSWGASCGDSPRGYQVAGAPPSLAEPRLDGTVSIYGALACLPYIPELTLEMMQYLYQHQPQTWGKYGFFDSYNLDVDPPWCSHSLYGIDKGCSMIMLENYLSGLVWKTYTGSAPIQKALGILGFNRREKGHE
jgi:hypothetical protein